ncbi:bifunctional riboflavin kinase/FAD synthetase [Blastococcus sp. MG754426]|uniref:bifunctional riboflavin kinase/FAD synthetase n=1 Tax=unclassified Blastococcus TaxID=2619396 RepID=UPI001EF0DCDD|nr:MULTISPECIES: bifunctional riboflavin kinase/FAD synthetase [unclassified Blastococcus]MCF6509628.1 bifunctional riboflavin kinase/FAD synthetase [Blastococcus sp. MG754426]MCF6514033.1 bifunctional riboflavin kinase/FAD synthetase [Blastococcus sp. MG754427]MCF6737110.1 bifunctional riboflavin kinase/FAD synthetase [Blastococcus sp. KM273129]
MLRWRGLESTPGDLGRTVVTVGMYDGVHRGHQKLIGAAVARARAMRRPCLLLTFDPHPAEVVRPGSHPAILTSLDRKAELVAELGVDAMCVLPFTAEFMKLPPETFTHTVLVERLHAAQVVVGENFTYGHRAAGTVTSLTAEGRRFGFAVEGVPLAQDASEDGEVTISSTYVRACVAAGDLVPAARALGRPHRVDGVVVRGDRRGRDLGYPTANVETPPYTAIPADGVYAGHLVTRDPRSGASRERFPAAISVGTNPTFQGSRRTVEAYVLDFDGDLYGEHVGVEFAHRLRPMAAFADVAGLLAAMAKDVEDTRTVLGL